MRSGFTAEGFDPYPHYDHLRSIAPVCQANWGDWLISGYHAVLEAFQHPLCMSVRQPEDTYVDGSVSHFFNDWLLFLDPPAHTQLRRELLSLFTPASVSGFENQIRKIAETLAPQAESGHTDFIQHFAQPFPVAVISEVLGLPQGERRQIVEWAEILRSAFDDRPCGPGRLEDAASGMRKYFLDLVADPSWVSKHGQSKFRGLINSYPKEAVAAQLAFLLFAGHETTVHLLGNTFLQLALRPQLWEQLRANPKLATAAIEEALRFDSPIQKICRTTASAVTIGGTDIPHGQTLVLLLGAANRDGKVFPHPHDFILRIPNRQIAFGSGRHLCLGRSLALLEARIGLEVLLPRWRTVALEDSPRWYVNASFRGLERLNLGWSGR
ncbi:MAG: cytochrome P450 [Hyphomicrobium sp.]